MDFVKVCAPNATEYYKTADDRLDGIWNTTSAVRVKE
jgi:hypothetical protein